MPQKKEKLPFLDGVRGYAALWVLIYHAGILTHWDFPIIGEGQLAVDVFMVMSGFLMAYHYYRRQSIEPWDARSTWLKFYVRRFFRIAPLFYLLLVIALLCAEQMGEWRQLLANIYPSASSSMHRFQDTSLSNIFMHVSFLFGFFPYYSHSTPLPDWSIGLEMQFYLAFPFLMLMFQRFSFVWMTIACSAVTQASYWLFWKGDFITFTQPSFLPIKLEFFVIGILLASAYALKERTPKQAKRLIVLAFLASILSAHGSLQGYVVMPSLVLLITTLLFYDRETNWLKIGLIVKWLEQLLGGRFAAFLADCSYSVYLMHFLILTPIAAFAVQFEGFLFLSALSRMLVVMIPTALLCYGIAPFLHKYVEQPGINLGKSFLSTRHPKKGTEIKLP